MIQLIEPVVDIFILVQNVVLPGIPKAQRGVSSISVLAPLFLPLEPCTLRGPV